MVNRRRFGQIAGGAALSALAAPAVLAQESLTIKFSHVTAPNTPKGKAAEKLRELVKSYSEGAVQVQVYHNSRLYNDKEEMEALQLGAVQMLAPSLAKFGSLGLQQFELFDLPLLFENRDDLRNVTEGKIGQSLLQSLATRNIEGLAFWDNGFKLVSANRPLHWPKDFQGLKVRVQASITLQEQMQALGAVPQVMAFSEVYPALQAGIVDGTENTASNMYTQKMHEVQKHATLSQHGYIGYALIVNQAFWNDFPADLREQVGKAVAEATQYGNSIAEQENMNAVEVMRASGTTEFSTLSHDQRAEWSAVLAPVRERAASRIGNDLVEQTYRAVGKTA